MAMKFIKSGKEIEEKWYHDPEIQNSEGNTVAMILLKMNKSIPERWMHDPSI